MSQVTPATSLRRCGSGERWLSIHIKSSESPIHMMPAMMWIQRSSRPSHSASTASMLLAASRRRDAGPTNPPHPLSLSLREEGNPVGASAPPLHWQGWRKAVEYAVFLHTGLLRGGPEGGR